MNCHSLYAIFLSLSKIIIDDNQPKNNTSFNQNITQSNAYAFYLYLYIYSDFVKHYEGPWLSRKYTSTQTYK